MSIGAELRNILREEQPIIPILKPTGEEVYCGHCHLATPTWRGRCIHCKEHLPVKKTKSAAVRPPDVLKMAG